MNRLVIYGKINPNDPNEEEKLITRYSMNSSDTNYQPEKMSATKRKAFLQNPQNLTSLTITSAYYEMDFLKDVDLSTPIGYPGTAITEDEVFQEYYRKSGMKLALDFDAKYLGTSTSTWQNWLSVNYPAKEILSRAEVYANMFYSTFIPANDLILPSKGMANYTRKLNLRLTKNQELRA